MIEKFYLDEWRQQVPWQQSLFLQFGWVSMFEMYAPDSAHSAKQLAIDDQNHNLKHSIRRWAHGNKYENGKFLFNYGSWLGKDEEFDMVGTCFYGPDIMRGIGLTAICELRRIGGDYQQERLKALSTQDLNKTLSQLFHIEAKISSTLFLKNAPYHLASKQIKNAIDHWRVLALKNLIASGIPPNILVTRDQTALFYACNTPEGEGQSYRKEIVQFLHQCGASLQNEKTTAAHVAAKTDNLLCLNYCLQYLDIDAINRPDEDGKTVLSYLLANQQMTQAEKLIAKGAKMPEEIDILEPELKKIKI